LSRAAPRPTDGSEAGFTIIEVLIAVAILAISIVAIGSVMATNARGVRSLEQHVALMQTARSVMLTNVPSRSNLVPGDLSGTVNDYTWRIDVAPLGGDWASENVDVAWTPQLVTVHVQSRGGAGLDLETIRLMPRPAQ
jgi:general secretion pathway protein I